VRDECSFAKPDKWPSFSVCRSFGKMPASRPLNSTDLVSAGSFVCVIGLNSPDGIGDQRVEIFELVSNNYAIL
jgi:hypothetical protein